MARDRDVVAFIHTYAVDGSFDPFMSSLIEAFGLEGVRLHVVRTNDLVNNLAAKSLSRAVREDKLLELIRAIDPAFIFSTNHGGITRRMSTELDIPLISWLVDHVPFEHDTASAGHFGPNERFVVSASPIVKPLEGRYPTIRGRVHYLPFATDPAYFQRHRISSQDINISFVGTYFSASEFLSLLRHCRREPAVVDALLSMAQAIGSDFRLDAEPLVEKYGLSTLLDKHQVSTRQLEFAIANAASANKRVHCLDAVADLGLQLWGTDNWVDVGEYSLQVLRCYKFGEFIRTREQLTAIYCRSRIALDCPHVQAVGGLPYRVFDILASPALLITEYHPESDLVKLFGDDLPVPMYRDYDDLRRLVRHYLSDERARKEAVARCNALVMNGFTFRDRVRDLFSIAGVPMPQHGNYGAVFVPRNAVVSTDPSREFSQMAVSFFWTPIVYATLKVLPENAVLRIAGVVRRMLPTVYAWMIRQLMSEERPTFLRSLHNKVRHRADELAGRSHPSYEKIDLH